jgi:hypothetical protein
MSVITPDTQFRATRLESFHKILIFIKYGPQVVFTTSCLTFKIRSNAYFFHVVDSKNATDKEITQCITVNELCPWLRELSHILPSVTDGMSEN